MKQKMLLFRTCILLVSLFLSVAATLQAQTLIYSNDFESGLNGATIVGNGVIEASGDAAHGMVFHNDPTLTKAVRTNYMVLPTTIFSDFQTSGAQALSISFWVNKSNAADYYWSAMFGAYGAAPAPTNGKPAFTLMSRSTGMMNFDYVNPINSTNYGWVDFNSGASTAWIDVAGWHFYTFTITPTTGKVYADGVLKNEYTFANTVNGLFNVASELKYITFGGNQAWDWNDPDPAFSFDKLKIYSGALTTAQINSLIATDGLVAPVLTASKSAISFYDQHLTETIVVNGASLANDITITAPAGITVDPATILKTAATDVAVTVTWDGTTIVDGIITLTSGSKVVNITVKSSSDAACFTPIYATGNMIADPTFSAPSLALGGFGGWGPTAIATTKTYCGKGTAYIRGTCWPDGGSIDRSINAANGNAFLPLTTYRLRAMVNSKASVGKSFQFQVEGVDGTASIFFLLPNTNGWKQIDTTFTTAATVSEKGIYFNSCGANTPAITDTCFIDNYELYQVATPTAVNTVNANNVKTFVSNNRIVSSFNLDMATEVSISLYNMNGMLIESSKSIGQSGKNERVMNTPLVSGAYMVRTKINGKFTVNKIIF